MEGDETESQLIGAIQECGAHANKIKECWKKVEKQNKKAGRK